MSCFEINKTTKKKQVQKKGFFIHFHVSVCLLVILLPVVYSKIDCSCSCPCSSSFGCFFFLPLTEMHRYIAKWINNLYSWIGQHTYIHTQFQFIHSIYSSGIQLISPNYYRKNWTPSSSSLLSSPSPISTTTTTKVNLNLLNKLTNLFGQSNIRLVGWLVIVEFNRKYVCQVHT